MPAGTVGPLTAQASGSGTHVAAGIQSAAFSLDLSQRQRAAHQSLTLETRSELFIGTKCLDSTGLFGIRVESDCGLPGAAICC